MMNSSASTVSASDSAKNGYVSLALSGAGLLLCCLPLGLVGAIQAGSAIKEAKTRGQASSPILGLARGLGWVSVLVTLGAYGFGVKSYLDQQSAAKSLQDSVATQRTAAVLEPKVACTLAKAELIKRGESTIECKQPLETKGNRAVLPGVEVKSAEKHQVLKVCFAKAKRWFVLETLEAGACSTREMDSKLKGLPEGDSEAALEKSEELYRKDEKVFKRFVRLVELQNRLDKIRGALSEEIPATCPDLTSYGTSGKVEVPYIEFSWMKKGTKLDETKHFSFMTKPELRDVLLDKGSETELAKSLDGLESAPLYVVFAPKEKPVWPSPRAGGFTSGDYTGSLFLVDAKTSKPLCEKPFHFENGEKISVRRSRLGVTSQSKIEDKLAADFEEHFEDAAVAAVKEISGDKLKLGMSWME